ncbi:MAG: ABC transporter ATP-binding protein [Deltaproteobacteria bacterium]|nr:ABC transporter ATP-binding protein [Deltaproteobacteria bacterium]
MSSRAPIEVRRESTPAIRVRHLWQRYGQRDVLRDVTFDVYPGEIYGFIGPNGAGKTTTIRVMATLLEPMSGRVELDGVDVSMDPERVRKTLGYMPDHAGVYERVTVREFLEFFADAHGIRSPGVVEAVLELTDIKRLSSELVATLSKGQKQRLQLARILLHDPKVLILDEPASDLDPRARIEIRDLLLDLQSLGKTILLSSHILSELSDICTSVGIIEQGSMVVSGPIQEIARRFAGRHGGRAAPPLGTGAESSLDGGVTQPAAAAPLVPELGPRRVVRVRVLGDLAAAAYALHGGPGILDVNVVGRSLHVGYVGGDEKVAELARYLVYRGFGVVGLEHERSELERIFLEATGTTGRGGGA